MQAWAAASKIRLYGDPSLFGVIVDPLKVPCFDELPADVFGMSGDTPINRIVPPLAAVKDETRKAWRREEIVFEGLNKWYEVPLILIAP